MLLRKLRSTETARAETLQCVEVDCDTRNKIVAGVVFATAHAKEVGDCMLIGPKGEVCVWSYGKWLYLLWDMLKVGRKKLIVRGEG